MGCAQEGIKLNVTGVANFDITEQSMNRETLFNFKAKDGYQLPRG